MTNDSQHLLPMAEPLQLHSELSPRMFLTPSPPPDLAFSIDSMRSDDLAFLIGHQDGLVQEHVFKPIPQHPNAFTTLQEVDDKTLFTQNMQTMERRDHKRKLTKQERKMDTEAKNFKLLLFPHSLNTDSPIGSHQNSENQTH
jgi:hypothetical protein